MPSNAKKNLIYLLLICIAGILLVSSLLNSGWHTSHDGVYHILRTEEALKMLKLGEFPLRWAGNLDQGFGIPLFTFVYPLPYYLSSIFSTFISSIWAVKTVMIASYILGGLGIYFLFNKQNKFIAFLLSMIYIMTPYQFLNIFVRGALGEVMAIGLIPWVLLSFNTIESTKKVYWYSPIALALLLISHNFLGILFGIFIFFKILLTSKTKKKSILNFIFSIGLSAFFLLPMFTERGNLYSLEMQTFTFRFDQHFIYLKQFIYGKWDYWYSLPGPEDGMSFQLGIGQIILSILGIVSIITLKKNRTSFNYFIIFSYLVSIFLMSNRSFIVWDKIVLLQTVQFPWRLLFMTTILSILLGSVFVFSIKNKKIRAFILLLLTILSFWNIRNYRRPMKQLTNEEYTDLYRLNLNKTTTTFRTEILPKWGKPAERYKSDDVLVNSGNMVIEKLISEPNRLEITINNKPDSTNPKLTVLRNYYPGWVVREQGKKKDVIAPTDEGMIYLYPEIGVHTYNISIENTPTEKVANMISLGSLFGLIYLWQKNKPKQSAQA